MTQEEISVWEIRLGEKILNPVEFGDGVRDCAECNDFKIGMGRDYLLGYSYEYMRHHNENI